MPNAKLKSDPCDPWRVSPARYTLLMYLYFFPRFFHLLRLCGFFRPKHFRGVTTIVLKLFNIVSPQIAYFGLKDAQQFFVLEKMTRDLNLDISVEGLPTVREPDGLALSSRNVFLSQEERTLAPEFYRVLKDSRDKLTQSSSLDETLNTAKQKLNDLGFKVQYLDLLQAPDLIPLDLRQLTEQSHLLAGAVYLGQTRLIDNVLIQPELLQKQGIKIHILFLGSRCNV